MLWVAIDRGLRLADKRSLPLPQRSKWLETRDKIYEEIMEKGWNKKEKFFAQAYESLDVIDSAVLIMPLTFFVSHSRRSFHSRDAIADFHLCLLDVQISAADPRFRSTLDRILRTPEKGGLTANNVSPIPNPICLGHRD